MFKFCYMYSSSHRLHSHQLTHTNLVAAASTLLFAAINGGVCSCCGGELVSQLNSHQLHSHQLRSHQS